MRFPKKNRVRALWGLLLSTAPAYAGNALNAIGYGEESHTMAGADVAVSRDSAALASNPAGLTQISGSRVDVFADLILLTDVGHRNSVGKAQRSRPKLGLLGGAVYATRLKPQAIIGLGFFVPRVVGYG